MELTADKYYLTEAGNKILRQAIGGIQITVSSIQTGAGDLPDDAETAAGLTALVDPRQTFPISGISTDEGKCKISAVINNDSLNTGYYVKEAGVFCISPDTGKEVLFAVAKITSNWVPPKGPGNVFNYQLSIYVVIGDATITLKVGSDLYELKEDALTYAKIYPIGSIYLTVGDGDPNKLFLGTTWEEIAEGRALISGGSNYTVGKEYGANEKTLTKDNLPAVTVPIHTTSSGNHQHPASDFLDEIGFDVTNGGGGDSEQTRMAYGDNRPWNNYKRRALTGYAGSHTHGGTTENLGSGAAFNVMQLSLAVHIWKRTA